MTTPNAAFVITASAPIPAPADRVYRIIADYHNGHPHILPRSFSGMVVEQGGVGEGTTIRFNMRILGRTYPLRAVVTEPEPGRVLVERNVGDRESVTTFTVDPRGADASVVTIATEMPLRPGLLGRVERYMTERVLRPLYVEELGLLAARAAGPVGASRT